MTSSTPAITKPMLFSGPMILRLLDGAKTMTRRLIKPQPVEVSTSQPGLIRLRKSDACLSTFDNASPHPVGSLVWCKETWAKRVDTEDGSKKAIHYLLYRADSDPDAVRDPNNWHNWGDKWKPSIFMPRWASRITLEITAVRVERLQDISEADAKAEGAELRTNGVMDTIRGPEPTKSYHTGFVYLWESINGKSHPWASNPYVFVYDFRRIKP